MTRITLPRLTRHIRLIRHIVHVAFSFFLLDPYKNSKFSKFYKKLKFCHNDVKTCYKSSCLVFIVVDGICMFFLYSSIPLPMVVM